MPRFLSNADAYHGVVMPKKTTAAITTLLLQEVTNDTPETTTLHGQGAATAIAAKLAGIPGIMTTTTVIHVNASATNAANTPCCATYAADFAVATSKSTASVSVTTTIKNAVGQCMTHDRGCQTCERVNESPTTTGQFIDVARGR